jgi:hypothetical protein
MRARWGRSALRGEVGCVYALQFTQPDATERHTTQRTQRLQTHYWLGMTPTRLTDEDATYATETGCGVPEVTLTRNATLDRDADDETDATQLD